MNRDERKQRILEIHKRHLQGLSIRELAKEFGLDRKTIERGFKRYGLPTQAALLLDEDLTRRLHVRYEQEHVAVAELAKRAGVAPSTLRNSFKRYGLPVRPGPVRFEPEWYPDAE